MAFVDSLDVTQPPGSQARSLGDDRIREMRRALVERLDVDHFFETVANLVDGANVGYHRKATLLEQGSDPSSLADALILYAKQAGSYAELHGRHENAGVKQLTLNGLLWIAALTVASEARGDQIVRGASLWGRIAIGAAHRIWRSDGTDPSWGQLLGLASLDQLDGAILKTNGGNNHLLAVTANTAARTFTLPDRSLNLTDFRAQVVGTYTGDGTANRVITVGFTDTGITPLYVLVIHTGGNGGHWFFTGMSNGIATNDGSSQSTGIKSVAANSFVIGDHVAVNANLGTFKFIAIG